MTMNRSAHNAKPVRLPTWTWGICRVKVCNIIGDLGDGYCQVHWDIHTKRQDDKEKGS